MFSKQFFDHWVPFKAILSNSDLSEMIQILTILTLVFSSDALRISQEKHKCLHECETRVVDLRRWEKLEAKFCRKNLIHSSDVAVLRLHLDYYYFYYFIILYKTSQIENYLDEVES